MSLDSLTDLVSNAVGVLILLLLVTAIQAQKPFNEPPLPIEHQSGLVPAFFYVHGDHIQSIDINAVFTNGLLAATEGDSAAEFQINADFTGRSDELLTLALRPIDTDNWPTFNELQNVDSPLGSVVSDIDVATTFAFLFVHDTGSAESFRLLSQARRWFLDQGIAVGWLPVSDNNPAWLCSWSDVAACQYSPGAYGRGTRG